MKTKPHLFPSIKVAVEEIDRLKHVVAELEKQICCLQSEAAFLAKLAADNNAFGEEIDLALAVRSIAIDIRDRVLRERWFMNPDGSYIRSNPVTPRQEGKE